MPRVRRTHVHIQVIDRDTKKTRKYPCATDQAQYQVQVEKECGHQDATLVTAINCTCLGWHDVPPVDPDKPLDAPDDRQPA